MGDPEAAAAELDRAMTQLGALGAQVYTNVSGAPLDDPRFRPVFDVVTGHGGTLWLHPTRSEVWSDYPAESRSRYGIWWSLGWPYETSVCMTRLVFSGYFDRYPGLQIIAHHAGAMVPHFAARLASPLEDPDRDAIMAGLAAQPLDYFRRFYTDSALFGAPHAVRCAVEFFGPRTRAVRHRHAARRPGRRRGHHRRRRGARPRRRGHRGDLRGQRQEAAADRRLTRHLPSCPSARRKR